jgi:hypothetical protein
MVKEVRAVHKAVAGNGARDRRAGATARGSARAGVRD